MSKSSSSLQPKCICCGRFFRADPRVGKRQKACSRKSCQKKRKNIQEKDWIGADKGYYKRHYEDVCAYRKMNPDYQKQWRAKKRRKMQTQLRPPDPVKSIRLHLRGIMPDGEMQTQLFNITQSGSDLWVHGVDMQENRDANAVGNDSS